MWQKVSFLSDGRIIYYYTDRVVTYRKDKMPEIKSTLYNKKEVYGFLGRNESLRDNISSIGRY